MNIHAALVAATAERLVAAGLCGGRVEIDRDRPAQQREMPFAVVHVTEDEATADGDGRTGVPDFVHKLSLCVDVVRKGSSGAEVKSALYADSEAVLAALLPDPTWLAMFEGVAALSVSYLPAGEGDVSAAGLRVAIAINHRTTWPPMITDDLTTITVGADMDRDGARDTGIVVTLPTV